MWAYETTFYQVYPLGFCGAPRENAAPVAEDELAQAANDAPNSDAPIMKIAQWADYLQELGVGAVLINPPLESDSHGYDTRSLRHIDRRLGGDADFAAVCETLHAHGIRVVLDAVFNHVGRGFWAFRDVQERKWDSPCKDWFHISFDGDSCYGDGFWYEGWEGHFELVKLNLQIPLWSITCSSPCAVGPTSLVSMACAWTLPTCSTAISCVVCIALPVSSSPTSC